MQGLVKAVGAGAAFVLAMYSTPGSTDNARRNELGVFLRRALASGVVALFCGVLPLLTNNSYNDTNLLWKKELLPKRRLAASLVLTLFAGVLAEWGVYFGARLKRRLTTMSAIDRASEDERRQRDDGDDEDGDGSKTSKTTPPLWLTVLRDFTYAPLTEEIVFRGGIQRVFLAEDTPSSPTRRVLLQSVIFSLAHFHHGIAADGSILRHRIPQLLLPPMLFGVLGGTMTELGIGVLPIAAAHGFCNCVGPPKWPLVVFGDDVVREEFFEQAPPLLEKICRVAFPAMHVVCVAAFVKRAMVA